MHHSRQVMSLLCLMMPVSGVMAQSDADNSAAKFSYNFDVRYRYEQVSQDNALADAEASTVRSRMTLGARPVDGLSLLLEVDNVSTLGPDDYDSFMTDRYRGTHSVVADPVGTDLNQLMLSWEMAEGQSLGLGRQRIIHANQRFVGGVAWRQNEQTYDAARLQLNQGELSVDYSYVDGVERIFGGEDNSIQQTSFNGDSHLMHSEWQQDWGTLSGFAYLLDFRNAPLASSATYGLSYAGSVGPLSLTTSYATQSDHGDNPQSFRTHYLALETGVALGPVQVALGLEELGSDGGQVAFSTPLSTLHLFQGWADMFLSTPQDGIKDAYMSLSGKWSGIAMSAIYHDFRAEEGGLDYGTEWDLIASYAVNKSLSTSVKYANYQRDQFGVDTEKFWFSLQYSF